MSIAKESDMFIPVKSYLLNELGCSKVYGEVGNCDALGLHGSVNIIVEMKKTLSFKVIEQAIDRLDIGHYVYIATPKKQSISRLAITILKQHKIGLLLVNEKQEIEIHLPARFNRTVNRKADIRKLIRPYHETQMGGVKSGEGITDYSVTMSHIKEYMERERRRGSNDGWVAVEQILEHCETHYSSPKPSVMATLQAKWNQTWCETKVENRKRFFRLKTKG